MLEFLSRNNRAYSVGKSDGTRVEVRTSKGAQEAARIASTASSTVATDVVKTQHCDDANNLREGGPNH